jgi:hypothetical protein
MSHLQSIGRIYPEQGKMIFIDKSNQFFFNHWNVLNEENRYGVVRFVDFHEIGVVTEGIILGENFASHPNEFIIRILSEEPRREYLRKSCAFPTLLIS